MAIKAAEYTVGFDTAAAKAAFASFEQGIKDGSVDAAAAVSGLKDSFNQVTNAHRTGKKEVDAWTRLIREENTETRTLGFLMRNASESAGVLSETMGGPGGLGNVVSGVYGKFDALSFAFDGIASAGEKAGGSFGKFAGLLGGIAVPAGAALAAFALMKEQFDKDVEEIEGLTESIRALKVELGIIPSTKLAELNRQMDELNKKKPEMGFFASLFQISPGQTVYLFDIAKQLLGIENDKLRVQKAQTEEWERQKQLGIQKVRDEDALVDAMLRNAELHGRLGQADEQSVASLQQQYQLRQGHITSMEATFVALKNSGAATKEIYEYDSRLTEEKIKQRELQKKIAEMQAQAASHSKDIGTLGLIDIWKQEYTFIEQAQKRLIMEARNAPLKLKGVASVDAVGTDEVLAGFTEYQDQAIALGDTLSSSLSSGFMKGFQTGKFQLSDFFDAMMQSILQMAAQQAAIAAVSGLLSLIPGIGSFTSIAGALGSKLFGSGKRMAGGGNGASASQSFSVSGAESAISRSMSVGSGGQLQQLVNETRALRIDLRASKPTVYVGGVISPDMIVSENLAKSERRRARRMK